MKHSFRNYMVVVPAVVVPVPEVVVPVVLPVVGPFMVPLLPVDVPVVAAPPSDIVEVPSEGIVDMVVSAFIPVSEFMVELDIVSVVPVDVPVEVESLPQLVSDRVAAVHTAAAKESVRFIGKESFW